MANIMFWHKPGEYITMPTSPVHQIVCHVLIAYFRNNNSVEYEEPDMARKSTSYEHDDNIYDYIPDYVRSSRAAGPASVSALPTMPLATTMVPSLENSIVQNGTNNNLNHVSGLLSYKMSAIVTYIN